MQSRKRALSATRWDVACRRRKKFFRDSFSHPPLGDLISNLILKTL